MCHNGCDTLQAPAGHRARDTSHSPCDTLQILNRKMGSCHRPTFTSVMTRSPGSGSNRCTACVRVYYVAWARVPLCIGCRPSHLHNYLPQVNRACWKAASPITVTMTVQWDACITTSFPRPCPLRMREVLLCPGCALPVLPRHVLPPPSQSSCYHSREPP